MRASISPESIMARPAAAKLSPPAPAPRSTGFDVPATAGAVPASAAWRPGLRAGPRGPSPRRRRPPGWPDLRRWRRSPRGRRPAAAGPPAAHRSRAAPRASVPGRRRRGRRARRSAPRRPRGPRCASPPRAAPRAPRPAFSATMGVRARHPPRDPGEAARVAEVLQVEQHHPRPRVVLPPGEQVVGGHVGLVAEADEGREPQPAGRAVRQGGDPEAAALRGEGDAPGRRTDAARRWRRRAPHRLRPRCPGSWGRPSAARWCATTCTSSASRAAPCGAGLGEARGQHHAGRGRRRRRPAARRRGPRRPAPPPRRGPPARAGAASDGWVAPAGNRAGRAVDRVQGPGEAAPDERGEDGPSGRAGVARRADDGDRAGPEEGLERGGGRRAEARRARLLQGVVGVGAAMRTRHSPGAFISWTSPPSPRKTVRIFQLSWRTNAHRASRPSATAHARSRSMRPVPNPEPVPRIGDGDGQLGLRRVRLPVVAGERRRSARARCPPAPRAQPRRARAARPWPGPPPAERPPRAAPKRIARDSTDSPPTSAAMPSASASRHERTATLRPSTRARRCSGSDGLTDPTSLPETTGSSGAARRRARRRRSSSAPHTRTGNASSRQRAPALGTRSRRAPGSAAIVTRAAENAISNAMPQSSRRLEKTPTARERDAVRARGHGGSDLARDDAEERHRGGLHVRVVQRRARSDAGRRATSPRRAARRGIRPSPARRRSARAHPRRARAGRG